MANTNRWYPLALGQAVNPDGYTITLTTDVACHLFLYYTFKCPWVHRRAGTERGLTVPWWAYWCYVVWILVEQDEPGDTTVHTFQIKGLYTCNHIWFRFHGTIAGQSSPSDSPIFHKHYVKPEEPPPTDLAYSRCEWTASNTIFTNRARGQAIHILDSGTAKTLTVDIDKWGNPGPIVMRLYRFDTDLFRPIEPHLWEDVIPDDDVPTQPDHTFVTLPIPETDVVKDETYCWGIRCGNPVFGNGYHLFYSGTCSDYLHEGHCVWLPYWTFNVFEHFIYHWFELKA